MSCGMGMIKYLLFIFNFIFAICGLAILIVGVVIHLNVREAAEALAPHVSMPAVTLIIIGSIIFVISFFGCCGAIRESHCMIVTFACFLLVILIVQVALGIYVLVAYKNGDVDSTTVKSEYEKTFANYWKDSAAGTAIDSIQVGFRCCGIDNVDDYSRRLNGTVPGSCCGKQRADTCPWEQIYDKGCVQAIKELTIYVGTVLGGLALGIGAVELCGIIFALCLANAIKSAERRGYRV